MREEGLRASGVRDAGCRTYFSDQLIAVGDELHERNIEGYFCGRCGRNGSSCHVERIPFRMDGKVRETGRGHATRRDMATFTVFTVLGLLHRRKDEHNRSGK